MDWINWATIGLEMVKKSKPDLVLKRDAGQNIYGKKFYKIILDDLQDEMLTPIQPQQPKKSINIKPAPHGILTTWNNRWDRIF